MENETVKKIEKVVPFGTGTAKLTIFEEYVKKAIERDWERLYYADNSVEFASLETEHEMFALVTDGLVSVVDVETDMTYTHEHPDELEKLLDRERVNGTLPEAKYRVEETNWFVVVRYEEAKPDSNEWQGKEGVTFDALPTSMDEFEAAFLAHAVQLAE